MSAYSKSDARPDNLVPEALYRLVPALLLIVALLTWSMFHLPSGEVKGELQTVTGRVLHAQHITRYSYLAVELLSDEGARLQLHCGIGLYTSGNCTDKNFSRPLKDGERVVVTFCKEYRPQVLSLVDEQGVFLLSLEQGLQNIKSLASKSSELVVISILLIFSFIVIIWRNLCK